MSPLFLRPLCQQQRELEIEQRPQPRRFSARFQVLRAESGKQILSCASDLKRTFFALAVIGWGAFIRRVRHGLKFCPSKPLNATQQS
jgi:hypothetical protein